MPKKHSSRRGRRQLSPENLRSEIVAIGLTPAEKEMLEQDADRLHLTYSEVLRIAWRAWRSNSLSAAIIESTPEGD